MLMASQQQALTAAGNPIKAGKQRKPHTEDGQREQCAEVNLLGDNQ